VGSEEDDSGPKVLVQVRVSPTTADRLETWVQRYAHVFNRPDVLRMIYEMGLNECDRLKRIDITLLPDDPNGRRRRRRPPDKEP
jgi:hypothetical protein